jgi:hypothetical protein
LTPAFRRRYETRRASRHPARHGLVCKPQKLTANVKADRRKKLRTALKREAAA